MSIGNSPDCLSRRLRVGKILVGRLGAGQVSAQGYIYIYIYSFIYSFILSLSLYVYMYIHTYLSIYLSISLSLSLYIYIYIYILLRASHRVAPSPRLLRPNPSCVNICMLCSCLSISFSCSVYIFCYFLVNFLFPFRLLYFVGE